MGICSSSSSTATAKLILADGSLREYPNPIKVSQVLQHETPTSSPCFVCDAEKLDYDEAFPAASDDEELQLGQLYFVFPLSQLSNRIQGEEMAALAVKASSALSKCKSKSVVVGSGGDSARRKSGLGKKSAQLCSIAE